MQMSGNTILITGGGSGIGQALAKAFHDLGNQVIITGRRQSALDETTAANPGMKSYVLDIENPTDIRSFATMVVKDFLSLNVVIHNAGIMRTEDVRAGTADVVEPTINTNLLGPIRLTEALLPHLLKQPRAAILTNTSGLAFVPRADTPTYSLTKAAIHSYTQSLRYQLKDTSIQVIALAPPLTQTELTGPAQAKNPNAMPLADYISETMHLLTTTPDATEILVERIKPQRFAERSGDYDGFFKKQNDTIAAFMAKQNKQ